MAIFADNLPVDVCTCRIVKNVTGAHVDVACVLHEKWRATAITEAEEAENKACAELARTYEDWCGNWGEIRNEIAARECAKEIRDAIKARALAPVTEGE